MVDRRFMFARGTQASSAYGGVQEPLFERTAGYGYSAPSSNNNFAPHAMLNAPSPLGNSGFFLASSGRTNSEDQMEIQQFRGLLEMTNHRVMKLEKMAKELEALYGLIQSHHSQSCSYCYLFLKHRLEDQNKQRLTLEKECSALRQQREENRKALQAEINNWQKLCEVSSYSFVYE